MRSRLGRGIGRRPRVAGRSLAVVAVLLATSAPAMLASAPAACAASAVHAGLVVDTGHEVVEYCVSLPGATVSGTQLIQLAAQQHGLDYRLGFGGKAVCRLDGVGTDSGDCFDQFPDFWGYWRAGPTGDWAWSSTGAADTSVGSGDLEGWVWGTGQDGSTHAAPPATTIDALCGSGATPPPGGPGGGGPGGRDGGGSGGGQGGSGGGGSGGGGGSNGGSGGGGREAGSGGQPQGNGSGGATAAPSPIGASHASSKATAPTRGAVGAPSGSESDPPTGDPSVASSTADETTEAALAAGDGGSGGVPFGALLALAAALALAVSGALLLRRSGFRGR